MTTGAFAGPPERSSTSETVRPLLSLGITEPSIADQFVLSDGSARASIAAAVTAATSPGLRMTAQATRRQRESLAATVLAGRASLRPQTANSAGETMSAAVAATAATVAPAIPIDLRNPCGNTVSVISAHATVAAEKATVRPAVRIVARIAAGGSAPPASSSRRRVTSRSE